MTSALTALTGEAFWTRLHDTAELHGPRRAVCLLYEAAGPATVVSGPAGHGIAPREVAGAGDGIDVREMAMLDRSGLVAVGGLAPAGGPGYHAWVHSLAWLRLGLSGRLLGMAMDYLAGRHVDGTALLGRQLIKGSVADVAIEQLQVRAALAGRPDPGAVREAHRQLTWTDRTSVRLLGAAGFTAEGPGRTAQISELLADAYVAP